jgi:hypothetical protein
MSEDDTTTGRLDRAAARLGSVIADEAVNAIGILAIAYISVAGVASYEPIAGIVSIALGVKYLRSKGGK